jgi:dienelactone hydrolase
MEVERVDLFNSSGDRIRGDLRRGGNARGTPVVIVCHSFMAFKDWGFFPYIGEKLAQAGFVTFVFNFSHNGVQGDDDRITDFGKFEKNTFTKELEDLDAVVDACASGRIPSEAWMERDRSLEPRRIVLLGHSRGGGLAIVHAAADRRVNALVTLSAIAAFDRWTPHQKETWRRLGCYPLSRDTMASPLRIGIDVLKDLENHHDRLNVEKSAASLNIPWLILHGKADLTVQPREAEELFAAANRKTTELVLLDRVGHLYNAHAPARDNYTTLNETLQIIIHWLHKTL